MKKYLIFLVFSFYSIVSAFSQAPTYQSANPVVTSQVGNTDIIKVKYSVKVRGNTGNSTTPRITVGSATVYSALGRFWTDVAFSKESDIIKINPLDSTEVWVVLENSSIGIRPQSSFSVGFSVGSLQNATTSDLNARNRLAYIGEIPNLVSRYPENGSIDALTNDTIKFKYSTKVIKGDSPVDLYIKNVATSNILIKYDINNVNVNLQADGYYINLFNVPLHTDSTYAVYFGDGFLFEDDVIETWELVAPITEGTWIFSTKEITAVPPFVPANASLTASMSNDFSITFSENIVKNVGYIYIKDYGDGSEFEKINVSDCTVSGATLTIPHSTLSGARHYYIEMDKGIVKSSTAGIRFRGITGKTIWHFTTESANVWTGYGTTTDFMDPDNWESGAYNPLQPTIIQNGGVAKITTAVSSTDFTISDIAKVEITSTGSLNVSGKLTMASTATSNSSLILNGALTVSPSNVYIYQFAGSTSSQRKGYSSPVSGATGTSLGITSAIRRFDNLTNVYVSVAPSTVWDPGVGYTTYKTTPFVFKGTINTATSYSSELRYTSDPGPSFQYSSAYNFYGNPYTSALDWKKMWDGLSVAEKALIYPSCWVERETGSWKVINPSTTPVSVSGGSGTEIPRGHAFMLRAKPGASGGDALNNLTFIKKAHLVASNQTLLKSGTAEVITKSLRFTAVSKNYRDDILYSFNSQSLFDFEMTDSEYQSFPSTSAAFTDRLQIATYSVSSTPIALAINTVPDFVNSTKFNVAYFAKNSGPYAIELTNVDEAFKTPNTVILLTDTVLNQTIPMVEGDKYYFYTDVTAAVVKNRFKIEIQSDYNVPTDITPVVSKELDAVSVNYSLYNINIVTSSNNLQLIEVYNINGTKLLSREVSGNSAVVPFEGSGVYVVKVISDKGVSSHKIVASAVR